MKGEKRLKNIILRIGIILLLFVMVFALTGCGSNNSQTSQEPQNEENTSQEGETVKLNDELEDVCGFAQQIEDGKYKIVALKEDGTIFDITNFGTTEYETLDYSGGKIYLQKEKDFYEIDLTKGNGNYELNKIFSYNLENPNHYKNMGVYDGKIYFDADQENLVSYDLETGETENVVDAEEIFGMYVNKKNGKIYYTERSPQNYLKEYDIKTGEIKTIDSADSESRAPYGNGTYYYNVSLCPGSTSEAILYAKEEGKGNDRRSNYYIYKVDTGEKIKIDDLYMSGAYIDGKLYYCAAVSEEPYPNYVLKVMENGNTKTIMKEQENSFMNFIDLGNGKVQAVMSWGQDISTEGEQAYLIDKETLGVEKTDKEDESLEFVYLIQEADNNVAEETR